MRTVFQRSALRSVGYPANRHPTNCRHDITRYVPFGVVTGREAANKIQGYTLLHSLPEQLMSRYHAYPVRRPAVVTAPHKEA